MNSDITRLSGSAAGRSPAVSYGNVVWTVATARTKSSSMKQQTADALQVIDENLKKMGTDKSRIVSATVYISDMQRKNEMNDAWMEWVDTTNNPQRACVGVALDADTLVEFVMIAAKK